jgi:hypothetical protein
MALSGDGRGTVSITNSSAAPVDAVLDVTGYFR